MAPSLYEWLKSNRPETGARRTFSAAFNNAFETRSRRAKARENIAFGIAWAAVKEKYRKTEPVRSRMAHEDAGLSLGRTP